MRVCRYLQARGKAHSHFCPVYQRAGIAPVRDCTKSACANYTPARAHGAIDWDGAARDRFANADADCTVAEWCSVLRERGWTWDEIGEELDSSGENARRACDRRKEE